MARNVLHLIDTGGPGGAETIYCNVVEGLDAGQWRSTLVLPERDWLSSRLAADGYEPLIVPSHGSFDGVYLARLARLVHAKRIDLIHAHLFTAGVYGTLAAFTRGVPVVCTFHGSVDIAANDRYLRTKFRILGTRRNRLVFVSKSLLGHFQAVARLDARITRVVYNGIDSARFSPSPNGTRREELASAGEILIGAVGNVRAPKAYDDLLRAAALLRNAGLRFRLVIAGDVRSPLYDDLLALRAELALEDIVDFLGFRHDIVELMRALDIYVLSSSAEGFSLTTVEAMATALPIVATRCGGPEEIISEGETGLLVAPRSPSELASTLGRLAGDAVLRRRLGSQARRCAEQRFSQRAMVAAYEAIYREALG